MRIPRLAVVDWTDAPAGRFKWTRPFRAKDEIWFLRVCHHISTGFCVRLQLKCDVTRWRTGGEVKGKLAYAVGTLHTTSEHGVSSITTADVHTSAASSRLNWRPPPADLNGLVRFTRKTKSGFCACAITFQAQSTANERTTLGCCVAGGVPAVRSCGRQTVQTALPWRCMHCNTSKHLELPFFNLIVWIFCNLIIVNYILVFSF